MPEKVKEFKFQISSLPKPIRVEVDNLVQDWQAQAKISRLWQRDSSLWTAQGEEKRLGWLWTVSGWQKRSAHIKKLTGQMEAGLRGGGLHQVVLLGMGGSSLVSEVLVKTFGSKKGFPRFYVLDSTDPAQIKSLDDELYLDETLFIVASKSGTTLESDLLFKYFFNRLQETLGKDAAGSHFMAITDPKTKLEHLAREKNFHKIFFGVPAIGGRFSALSDFGMVTACLLGIDMPRFLGGVQTMIEMTSEAVAVEQNQAAVLGIALGVLANAGRNKLTLVISPRIRNFGAWLEQLIAESTGKDGKGIIPIDRETLMRPESYDSDRTFVYIRLNSEKDATQERFIDKLVDFGQPVLRIELEDEYRLGGEFFRWEFATAVCGAVMGINPFNQPDVEASKQASRKLTAEYEQTGSFTQEEPILKEKNIKLFLDPGNLEALSSLLGKNRDLVTFVRAHLSRLKKEDYFAFLAYLPMNRRNETALQSMRTLILKRKHVATAINFGPRFLHSTGQAYKGGPNSGVFIQITCKDSPDLAVPGHKFTFGAVKAAQALGDFQVLAQRQRRIIRLHLETNVSAGLNTLNNVIEAALK
jgi:transaldolase/glucose-6-phosphate isomerase